MQITNNIIRQHWQNLSGTRIAVAAFGILCGLTGIIAGFFEILQGNIIPSGLVISTIGSDYSMVDDFTYFAITIIPNFLVTGILAVTFSCLVMVWSVKFIGRKYGVLVFLLLSFTQMLVGGGWVMDLAIMASILATRINRPLNWWCTHLPESLQRGLTKIFPISLIGYAIISFIMLFLTFIGINDMMWHELMGLLAGAMFIPMLLLIFGAIAHDLQRQSFHE